MPTFSKHFNLNKSQGELDFVDVDLNRDIPLFVDPFAISQGADRWSQEAHRKLTSFFQKVIDLIREGRFPETRGFLAHFKEPNETRFGLSRNRPQGSGVGPLHADSLLNALRESKAVETGFLSSLEECELMIDGIGPDRISDLSTNIIRGSLAAYTKDQCELLNIPTRRVALGPHYSLDLENWKSERFDLPIVGASPILLVPKGIARARGCYDHQTYYRDFALEYLQAEHLAAGSALVTTLKNGKRKVYKTDLEATYPCTKDYLFRFSQAHPEVLGEYRDFLAEAERAGPRYGVVEPDERVLARALVRALRTIRPGPEEASEYHRLMVGVLEFILFPQLGHPTKEKEIHEGRKRIDVLMENRAREGIFDRLHSIRGLPSAFVAFECKNYSRDIANEELDQIAGRFSPNRGRVGFVTCRRFADRQRFIQRCRDTFRDDRGLVIPIDDETVERWLTLISEGRRDDLDNGFTDAVNEVWVS